MVSIAAAQQQAIAAIARPGDWMTAAQRVDVWRHARDAATNPLDLARRAALSPFSVDGAHPASDELSAAAV
ncbi:MAG: alkylhydroperoxidase-related (seleno)protein, partial [Ilumatobacter sp.]